MQCAKVSMNTRRVTDFGNQFTKMWVISFVFPRSMSVRLRIWIGNHSSKSNFVVIVCPGLRTHASGNLQESKSIRE
jgi:hypothetical protein